MAYQNIVFIKLEKRLLNDWRYYMMSENSQLNFTRLLMLAGETYNKIPLSAEAIKLAFRTKQDTFEIERTIKEIMINFPKFKRGKNFYYIEDFESKTNWRTPEKLRSKRSANAQQATDKDKEEDIDKEHNKEIKKKTPTHQNDQEFLDSLRSNPAYKDIDIDIELSKMDAWLSTRPGKKKTRRWVVAWLNRIDKILPQSNGRYTAAQLQTAESMKRLEEKLNVKS